MLDPSDRLPQGCERLRDPDAMIERFSEMVRDRKSYYIKVHDTAHAQVWLRRFEEEMESRGFDRQLMVYTVGARIVVQPKPKWHDKTNSWKL